MAETTSDFDSLAPLRPAIHLTPPAGWMNDPNGLCKVDGVWHSFYQHDPESITHGVMHWGHATSTDLLRWENRDIALAPDQLGVIFSGSAVVDATDSAGFGADAVVAIFTHDLDGLQRQSLAYSTDGGMTFTKYANNPVLEGDAVDFRDPKVVETADGWVMALAVGDRINFYASRDLRCWTATGSYSFPLPGGGVWECPDLIRFPQSADPAISHVLTFCTSHAGPYGHSGTLYVPGAFRSGAFEPAADPELLDHGPDFYATQSFSSSDNSGQIVMAWMNSWTYANTHPARSYRGVMSLPRKLELDGDRLRQRPALDAARYSEQLDSVELVGSDPHSALLIEGTGELDLELTGRTGKIASVKIDSGRAVIHRHGDFIDDYSQCYSAPAAGPGSYQVIIDHGTIEVFASNSRSSLSALTFGGTEWEADISGATTVRRIR